jgi:hypothetical protein
MTSDDARLHSAPTYVHCKAGKSRSVTVVLAYLIHANAWTFKTSYAYVAERRKGISPNIGFVAELMQFEEAELGLKHSGGVHGDNGDSDEGERRVRGRGSGRQRRGKIAEATGGGEMKEGGSGKGGKGHPRYARDSLPSAWASSSLDSRPSRMAHGGEGEDEQARRVGGGEREVRKNGQWVHSRR